MIAVKLPAAVIVLSEQFSKLALRLKPHKQRICVIVRMASMLKLDFTPRWSVSSFIISSLIHL